MKTVIFKHTEAGKVSHLQGVNQEYTLCGLAIADSCIDKEGFVWLPLEKEMNANCENCLSIVSFCKSIPDDKLKRKPVNPFY